MMRWLIAATATAVLVAAGVVHGTWTNRWTPNEETAAAAELLQKVPYQFGEWKGADVEKANAPPPGVAGCLQRRYVNQRMGASVTIALVNGQPGPVGTHTPEACYGASGYTVERRKAVRLDTQAVSAQFWTADALRSRVTDETRIRLFWAWNGGQGWVASNDARNEFPRFRCPVLHKLYVIRDLGGASSELSGKEEPCETFLNAFLPELEKALFAKN